MNWYPKEVYSYREDITRKNMEEYDRKKKLFYDKCVELDSNFFNLGFRERTEVRDAVEALLGFRI